MAGCAWRRRWRVSDEAVRLAVIGKLGWIKRQQARFEAQPRQSQREMVSGESHYFLGRRYRLRVVEHDGPGQGRAAQRVDASSCTSRPEPTPSSASGCCSAGIASSSSELVPPLLEKWQAVLGVQVAEWGIKQMKTKWGTCNPEARRIWLNLELAKKPPQCLEYIVVHELAHLIERHHNDRFRAHGSSTCRTGASIGRS